MAGRLATAAIFMETPEATRPDSLDEADRLQPEDPALRQEAMCLFDEHGAALYRFCLFTLRHQQDAEDVVQDTFLKLLQHLAHGATRSSVRSWLFTVAANGCRDRYRRRIRWLPWRDDKDRRVAAADAELACEQDEQRAALQQAARTLRPRDRLLLMLRVQGLSYREIGVAAGIPEASVGRLLARALARWKQGYASLYERSS
jgi:RNA polymerase sigma-70 factor (ECF subfamily)